MRDGRTRKLKASAEDGFAAFVATSRAVIVIVDGGNEGMEFPLVRQRVTLGRGPGADLTFDDSAMSRVHAAIEFIDGGFHLRDLDSTNGTAVEGDAVELARLENGARLRLGNHVFRYVVEEREKRPKTWALPDA